MYAQIAGMALGAVQSIIGAKQAASLKDPGYQIAPEFQNNVALGKNIKNSGGFSQSRYGGALQNIARNQVFGLNAAQDRRSGTASIANLVQRSNDANLNLDAADATMAQQNKITGAHMEANANQQLGLQRVARNQYEQQRYQQKMQSATSLVSGGMGNIFGSLTSLAAGKIGGGMK